MKIKKRTDLIWLALFIFASDISNQHRYRFKHTFNTYFYRKSLVALLLAYLFCINSLVALLLAVNYFTIYGGICSSSIIIHFRMLNRSKHCQQKCAYSVKQRRIQSHIYLVINLSMVIISLSYGDCTTTLSNVRRY